MKQIQGSVRVKIKERSCMVRVFFSFHFLSFSISLPKLNTFTILRLYMACKMWKITALTGRKTPCLPFLVYYFLYNWIGVHENLLRIQKKGHKNRNDTKWRNCCLGVLFAHAQVPSNSCCYHIRGNEVNCVGSSEYLAVFASFSRASFLNTRADQSSS